MSKYKEVLGQLKEYNTKLVLVSKTKPVKQIQTFYDLGQRDFGENRIQELVSKYEELPKDIKWHQIGHVQKNKVKYIAPFINLIHAVDSLKILKEINKRAKNNQRTIDVLLQIKIAKEETKFGLTHNQCIEIITDIDVQEMKNLRIVGLMGMSTFTDNMDQVRSEFKGLKHFFDILKTKYYSDKNYFSELSMGMSGDYQIAIEEGATMVRIGSLIMGGR